MRARVWLACVLVVLAAMVAAKMADGGPADPGSPWVREQAERDGLILGSDVVEAHGSIAIETRLENHRRTPVELVPDQCGRVTVAVMRRTRFETTGRRWTGSVAALKRLVLRRQELAQEPESFAPRRPGESSSAVPSCERPSARVRLAPGGTIRERWELRDSSTLKAVGSAAAIIEVSAVEADATDRRELLDLRSEATAKRRRARTIRTDTPAAAVLSRPPAVPTVARSPEGVQFDAFLADPRLRAWIEAQPASSWRHGDIFDDRLHAVTTRYERGATATLRSGRVSLDLPGPEDRAHPFPSRKPSLPPGVRVVRDARNAEPTRDIVPGRITLPTGRLAVGGDGFERDVIEPTVAPGRYPVRITLARVPNGSGETPALASLHISDRRVARWKRTGGIGTDGATGGFTSAEGAAAFARLGDGWDRWFQTALDSETAHDFQATRILPLGKGTDAVQFSTGASDGGYPLFVGLDANGDAVRFVFDFGLMHLAWPRNSG